MATKTYTFQLGDREISYRLTKEWRKRFRIVIAPDLTISIQAPRLARKKDIDELLLSKRRWIIGTIERIEKFHPLSSPKEYVSGETLLYLGRQYRLKVVEGEPQPAKMKGKYLQVTVIDKSDTSKVKATVDAWYRKRSKDVFNRILIKSLAITSRHGIAEANLSLRRMRSRWGSCSSKGRITINTALVQAPMHCVEYVIMHELCHLKHHNHSKAFYKLLTQCMPDWQSRKEILQRVVISSDPENIPNPD